MTAEGGPAAALARWGVIAATTIGCVVAAGFDAAAAPGSDPDAAYWWQPEPVSGLIPVPGVPSNGLYIASSPTGPQAEAAVRIDTPEPTGFVRLTLHVSLQERVGRPAVVAYPATSHWQTGGPQAWSARPSYRASAKPVRGVFSRRGEIMTLTFPARDAALGVVLLPDTNASNTFTIAFTPPRSADVSIQPTATRTPRPSASASASHRPTPTKSHHSATPSTRPSRPHKTHKPSKSPKPSRTASTTAPPSPSGSPSPVAPSGAAARSGHSALIAAIIAAIVVAGAGAGVAVGRRRRQ